MRVVQQEKGKAVFVDGKSANAIKSALGIELYDFHGLYDVMVNQVGKCKTIFNSPCITIEPSKAAAREGLIKDLTGAGFEAIPVASRNSADDMALRRLIQELSPRDVCEIVVFTSDKDFIPSLRSRVARGIHVYWVSTKRHDPELRRHRLSLDVITLCTTTGFSFVELGDFIPLIDGKRPRSSSATSPDNEMVVTIRLPSQNRTECQRLTRQIELLVSDFDGLTFDVTG